MEIERFNNYNDAIRAALDWLRSNQVKLEEVFETRMGSFGMRNLDRSGGYRLEFDDRSQAHIDVWCHKQTRRHYTFPGNRQAVKSLWTQLYTWNTKVVKRRIQE